VTTDLGARRINSIKRHIALEITHAWDGVIAHADETVLIEFRLTGTHPGPLKLGHKVVQPTDRAFKVRMAASFEFKPGADKIACERPNFEQGAVLRALQID